MSDNKLKPPVIEKVKDPIKDKVKAPPGGKHTPGERGKRGERGGPIRRSNSPRQL
jgi:hypothetical protein